jgi:hypothetical protein
MYVLLKHRDLNSLKPYHVELLTRYITQPPLNTNYILFSTHGTRDDAMKAMLKDAAVEFKKNQVPGFSLRKRFEIFKRDKYRCQLCGKDAHDAKLEIDHKIPRIKGGSDDESNLWVLCFFCNRGKFTSSL